MTSASSLAIAHWIGSSTNESIRLTGPHMNFLLTYRSLDDNIHRHLKWICVCLCLIDSQFDGTRVTVVRGRLPFVRCSICES
jgi:hypothetical protein